jgi:hypothetical protein
LGVGLSFSNAFTIYGEGFASAYTGIRSRSPTWEGDLVPSVLVVPYRSRWFSPYVLGGIGPRFVNNGKPTLAVWQAGAGAFIGLGGPVFLDIGVGFQQAFPRDRCDRAYTFETTETPAALVTLGGACLVTISPRIGLAIGLGVGRGERKRSRGSGGRGTAPAVQGSSTFEPPTPSGAPAGSGPGAVEPEPPVPEVAPETPPAAPSQEGTGSPPIGEGEVPAETTAPVDPEAQPAETSPPSAETSTNEPSTDETPAPNVTPDAGAPRGGSEWSRSRGP